MVRVFVCGVCRLLLLAPQVAAAAALAAPIAMGARRRAGRVGQGWWIRPRTVLLNVDCCKAACSATARRGGLLRGAAAS